MLFNLWTNYKPYLSYLRDKKIYQVLYIGTIKPFDRSRVSKIFKKYNKIVVKDNSEIAGLGSLIKSLAYEMNFKEK